MKATAAASLFVITCVSIASVLPSVASTASSSAAEIPMGWLLDPGIQLIVLIQGWGGWLESPMRVFTFFGEEEFFLLILPLLYWCVSAEMGVRVGLILLVNDSINNTFKLTFHGPRPYWYSAAVTPFVAEGTFGVPSGHSQNAAAVWGMVATRLGRRWVWGAALAVIVLIGVSRLYLAAHFPHDVVLGWAFGFIVLWLFSRYWDRVARRAARLRWPEQVLLAFGVSTGLIASSAIALWVWGNWMLPAQWVQRAAAAFPDKTIDPASLSGTISTAALFFGLAAGLAWLSRQGGHDVSGPLWQRAARFAVGLVGLLAIDTGLDAVFPEGTTMAAHLGRYLRYAAVGLWVSALAPMVFARIRLAAERTRRCA